MFFDCAIISRVPGSGVRGRGSGERETTASSLAGKEESSRKEDNGVRWTPKFGQVAKRESRS